jgi:ribosome recycling factor
MTTSSLLSDADSRMRKTIEAMKRNMSTVRTGRASPSLVENLSIDYHGVATPLNQLASIVAPEARLVVVQPWDRQCIPEIEKSILKSHLGLNPSSDGTVVRLSIPLPTEEGRRELVKVVKKHAEEARVAIRNIRRDTIEKLRGLEHNKELSQDESRRSQDQVQKTTDSLIGEVDAVAKAKETAVMEV